MSGEADTDTYALRTGAVAEMPAPDLDYRPPKPRAYAPRIGLIGAGGIAVSHLDAYRAAGWEVAAICNRTLAKAQDKAARFYPDALVTDDPGAVIDDPTIDVVDITPHPADRLPLMRAALDTGKHVLSQKPFVLDLDEGERLADLAEARGVKLAVNQNGRWAPHLAWMRAAVQAGLIGDLTSCQIAIHWDHSWIAGTPFERVEDLILYDFGIHWFDFLASIAGGRATEVFASASKATGQGAAVPLMAQALVTLTGGQAALVFNGAAGHGPRDTTVISGTKGTLRSDGPSLSDQQVTLTTAAGQASPVLTGTWFNDGFAGAMGALLVAIEDDTEPANGARENLDSLAMAFAAIRSRQTGASVPIGAARRIAP